MWSRLGALNVKNTYAEADVVFSNSTSSPSSTVRRLLINVGDHIVLHVEALPQAKVIEEHGLVGAVRYVGHSHVG